MDAFYDKAKAGKHETLYRHQYMPLTMHLAELIESLTKERQNQHLDAYYLSNISLVCMKNYLKTLLTTNF